MAGRLIIADGSGNQSPWSSGCAQFWIERDTQDDRVLIVAARCRLGSLDVEDLALVDTGAQWSVIGGELAELVGADLHDRGAAIRMLTRLGPIEGHLHRLAVTLVADDGLDLEVSGTVLIAPDWTGPPVVLGYRGFLERVRVAFDPGIKDDDQWMYFSGAA